MRYQFLIDAYRTEIEKVLSVWAMFDDEDLGARPHRSDPRGRSLVEHMVHQSVSENLWLSNMLGVVVTDAPLPAQENRLSFMAFYAENAGKRLAVLEGKDESWWEETVDFFDTKRTRAWVMVRRIAHTAHHRGQQTALLRMLNHNVHSTYGPTADTGGLLQDQALTIYAYPDAGTLLKEESQGRSKNPLPGPGDKPPTERP